MKINDVLDLVRSDIKAMHAYSSARSLTDGDSAEGALKTVYLDANESPVEPFPGAVGLNRYESQQPQAVLDKMAKLYHVEADNIMMTRGSDEAIDVIIRTFCQPGSNESILHTPPTFGMYAQYAAVNATPVISVPLDSHDFSLDKNTLLSDLSKKTDVKILFLCSPNNPTGSFIPQDDLIEIIQNVQCMVVVDEAYIEYCDRQKLVQLLPFNPNLILLRTMSKTRSMAGIRLGCALGHKDVIAMLRKVLPPYPMTKPVMDVAEKALQEEHQHNLTTIREKIIDERERMAMALKASLDIDYVWPSSANFLLVRVNDPEMMMLKAKEAGVILRDMSALIARSIRITIGLPEENDRLLKAWGISVQSS